MSKRKNKKSSKKGFRREKGRTYPSKVRARKERSDG